MPSQAALRRFLRELDPDISAKKIKKILRNSASVAIPARTHQKHSETYGGRNSEDRQIKDAQDLRVAVDNNVTAIKPHLSAEGYSEIDIETVRFQMHKINQEQGWY